MELIADTTVVSNFALVRRLDLLRSIKHLVTTNEVAEELKVGVRRGLWKKQK